MKQGQIVRFEHFCVRNESFSHVSLFMIHRSLNAQQSICISFTKIEINSYIYI